MKNGFLVGLFLILSGCGENGTGTTNENITKEILISKLQQVSNKVATMIKEYPIDSTQIPRSLHPDGTLKGSTSYDWTSGFYAGTLWKLYRFSGIESIGQAANSWTAFQEKEKWDTHTHDLGFKLYSSFGEADKTEPSEKNKEVLMQASKTLIKRYSPTVGSLRSWDFNQDTWQFPVIIDNMMNLEMLFKATQISGDSIYFDIAYQHALTAAKNHFRADNSSYHVIDYDTLDGSIRNRHTHQGASHESAWSRGQAWGLYGFIMAYRFTSEPLFLERAKEIADFFFEHPNLPLDHIPYWDFNAPKIPNEPRDASAAAIAASGLLELIRYDPENKNKYLDWVDVILNTLNSPDYQASTIPFLLKHSVGSVPGNSEVDVPLIYADYYYVEALLRRLALEQNTSTI